MDQPANLRLAVSEFEWTLPSDGGSNTRFGDPRTGLFDDGTVGTGHS